MTTGRDRSSRDNIIDGTGRDVDGRPTWTTRLRIQCGPQLNGKKFLTSHQNNCTTYGKKITILLWRLGSLLLNKDYWIYCFCRNHSATKYSSFFWYVTGSWRDWWKTTKTRETSYYGQRVISGVWTARTRRKRELKKLWKTTGDTGHRAMCYEWSFSISRTVKGASFHRYCNI